MGLTSLTGFIVFIIFCLKTFSTTEATVEGYITSSDKVKLLSELKRSLSNVDDVSTLYYVAKGLSILGEPLEDAIKKENCGLLQKLFKSDETAENTLYALSAWKNFGCAGKLHNENTVKNLRIIAESDKSTLSEIRYACEGIKLLGQSLPNGGKVAQIIQSKLKEDDSLLSLGHAIHAASFLDNAGAFALDRVEDVVVQADEIDGKLLQWEGGLSMTSHLITGLLRLNGATPFTQIQADKLGNYLLSRKTVQNSKGIVALLDAVSALSSSNTSPVCISVLGPSFVTVENPNLKIQVSNMLGKALKSMPSPVVAQSATRISDDVVVLSKQVLSPGVAQSEFILPLNLEPGQYRIALSAGSHLSNINVRVLGAVTIKSFEIGLSDTDGGSVPQLKKLQYPAKLQSALQGDSSQLLVVKFQLSRQIHQTFLRLYSAANKEVIFIAELDSSKTYKIEVNLNVELTYSGKFEMELILGDSVMSNPIKWNLGAINVKLGQDEPDLKSPRALKPEIQHLFRKADKRPPQVVSLLFTALTTAPLLLLLIIWLKIGINFGNFTAAALPFHIGFGLILSLFLCFWLKLDMFQTCAWLIPLGAFTFLAGHRLLSHIASSKTKKIEK